MTLTQHSVPGTTEEDPHFALHYARLVYAVMRLVPRAIERSGVEVTDEEVRVLLCPGADVHILRDSITRVWQTTAAQQRVARWLPPMVGMHSDVRGVWWLNWSLDNLVAIDIDPPAIGRICGIPVKPKRVIVSLDDPEAFIAEILG